MGQLTQIYQPRNNLVQELRWTQKRLVCLECVFKNKRQNNKTKQKQQNYKENPDETSCLQ